MPHQSGSVKKGLKLAMGIAVCVWLLYQIKESSMTDRPKPNQAVVKELLGRKWKVGLTDGGGGDSEYENGNGFGFQEVEVEGNEDEYDDQHEIDVGIHGFRDENGIPADGFELVDSMSYENDQTQYSDYYQ